MTKGSSLVQIAEVESLLPGGAQFVRVTTERGGTGLVHLDTSIPNFVVQEYTVADECSKWSGFAGRLAV